MIAAILCAVFALEWDSSYRTDVPYEVDLSTNKLHSKSFSVLADGMSLPVSTSPGKLPGDVTLRFNVPRGTKKLTCNGSDDPPAEPEPLSECDNPFALALEESSEMKWHKDVGVGIKAIPEGFLFTAPDKLDEAGDRRLRNAVSYTVSIPPEWAGKPVVQEIELENCCPLVVPGICCIVQLNEFGEKLPETVADVRWTSHLRPPGKSLSYRDEGHIHLDARKLRFFAMVGDASSEYDAYGYPLADSEMTRAALAVKRISVRLAAKLPFPKWNERCFGNGISGASLVLGGDRHQAMFFQATSRAGWSQKHQFRNDDQRTFPSQRGTVEAWFKRRIEDERGDAPLPMFEANHCVSGESDCGGRGSVLRVDYRASDKTFLVHLVDVNGRKFEGEAVGIDLPPGIWTHVALQWNPGYEAELFVAGRRRLAVPLAGFAAPNLNDESVKNVNDLWATDFYFGSDFRTARQSEDGRGVYFEGEGDELRVSSVCRYSGDFKPVWKPSVDCATSAYFSFDRVFDGVMGTGFGFVPACVRADDDRVQHVVEEKIGLRTETIQYYPRNAATGEAPAQLERPRGASSPSGLDFRAAKSRKSKTVCVCAGDRIQVKARAKAFPLYTEFRNLSLTKQLMYPILVEEGRLDPRSFGDLADSLAVGEMADRERADRIFQHMLSSIRCLQENQCPSKDASGISVSDAANAMSAVAGCAAGVAGGYGLDFAQVFYSGKDHVYDLISRKSFPAFDNETSAGLKEMEDQPGLLQRGLTSPDRYIRRGSRGYWLNAVGYGEKSAWVLNPGERLRVYYSNRGRTSDSKGRFRDNSSTALVEFSGKPSARNPAFASERKAFTYHVKSCYPITYASCRALRIDGSRADIEMSVDGGKSYVPIELDIDGVALSECIVRGCTEYDVRVKAPMDSIRSFTACTESELPTQTYPGWVTKGGTSTFQFKAEPGAKAEVTLAWNEPAKEIVVEGTVKRGKVPGCEREMLLFDPYGLRKVKVLGVSHKAKVRTRGPLTAHLRDGVLMLSYDARKPRVLPCGADNPEPRHEFPQLAAFDVVDGDAVKTVAVLISPDGKFSLDGCDEPAFSQLLRAYMLGANCNPFQR